jgi:hypothetical protein
MYTTCVGDHSKSARGVAGDRRTGAPTPVKCGARVNFAQAPPRLGSHPTKLLSLTFRSTTALISRN